MCIFISTWTGSILAEWLIGGLRWACSRLSWVAIAGSSGRSIVAVAKSELLSTRTGGVTLRPLPPFWPNCRSFTVISCIWGNRQGNKEESKDEKKPHPDPTEPPHVVNGGTSLSVEWFFNRLIQLYLFMEQVSSNQCHIQVTFSIQLQGATKNIVIMVN